jgi:DNA-binding FadR family transcriptional regulator
MARTQRDVVARVETALLEDIVAGRLAVGARLPPEAELARSMGISRFVEPVDASVVTDAILLLVRVNGAAFDSVVEARRAIAPVIAALAARSASPEDVQQLSELLSQIREGLTQGRFESGAMVRFHLQLCEMAANPILEAVARPLTEVVGVFVSHWWADDFQTRLPPVLELHESLLEAIRARDATLAGERMTELMARTAPSGSRRLTLSAVV